MWKETRERFDIWLSVVCQTWKTLSPLKALIWHKASSLQFFFFHPFFFFQKNLFTVQNLNSDPSTLTHPVLLRADSTFRYIMLPFHEYLAAKLLSLLLLSFFFFCFVCYVVRLSVVQALAKKQLACYRVHKYIYIINVHIYVSTRLACKQALSFFCIFSGILFLNDTGQTLVSKTMLQMFCWTGHGIPPKSKKKSINRCWIKSKRYM